SHLAILVGERAAKPPIPGVRKVEKQTRTPSQRTVPQPVSPEIAACEQSHHLGTAQVGPWPIQASR
ncbi:MAG: hypothetical protein ACT60Q_23905, partial [Ferrovibrionaceae bacterium]